MTCCAVPGTIRSIVEFAYPPSGSRVVVPFTIACGLEGWRWPLFTPSGKTLIANEQLKSFVTRVHVVARADKRGQIGEQTETTLKKYVDLKLLRGEEDLQNLYT